MNIIMLGRFFPQPLKTNMKQTVSDTIIPEIQNINNQRLKECLVKSSSVFNAALCCLTACVPTSSPPSKREDHLNYGASHPTTGFIFYPSCLQDHPPFLQTLISHLSMHRGGAGVCTRKHVHGQKRHGLLFYPDPSLSAGNSWHTTVGYCLCGCVCECVHVTTRLLHSFSMDKYIFTIPVRIKVITEEL